MGDWSSFIPSSLSVPWAVALFIAAIILAIYKQITEGKKGLRQRSDPLDGAVVESLSLADMKPIRLIAEKMPAVFQRMDGMDEKLEDILKGQRDLSAMTLRLYQDSQVEQRVRDRQTADRIERMSRSDPET